MWIESGSNKTIIEIRKHATQIKSQFDIDTWQTNIKSFFVKSSGRLIFLFDLKFLLS